MDYRGVMPYPGKFRIVKDRSYGIWNRDAAYRALIMIDLQNEKLKELSKWLIENVDNEEEKELVCLLIPRMMVLKDKEIYEMCKEFIEKHGTCYPIFHDEELDEMWEENLIYLLQNKLWEAKDRKKSAVYMWLR